MIWLMDTDEEDSDAQFIRNIRIASTRYLKSSARNSPKTIFKSFVRDLSFWEVSESTHYEKSTRKKRRSPGTASVTTKSSSDDKMMKNRDKSFNRSNSTLSTESSSKPVWKTAVDLATGRTYYYDIITRKTQWNKPPEVREMEKKKKQEKRKKDKEFFEEMEKNVLESLARGLLIPGVPVWGNEKEVPLQEPQHVARVRTISGMDEILLAELRDDNSVAGQQQQQQQRQNPSSTTSTSQNSTCDKSGRPPLPTGPKRLLVKTLESLELSPDEESSEQKHPFQRCESELAGEKLLDDPIQTEWDLSELECKSPPGGHTRRNTGGTIYLQNTMTNPDVKATIKCVCGVYRAHIVQAAERDAKRSLVSVVGAGLDFDVFLDENRSSRKRKKAKIPSLADVVAFYEEFYRRSRMEHDTIIMSLIYVERLVKATNGGLTPMPENWRSVLFACMVLASKVWDDLSMWNIDFSNVSAGTVGLSSFTLHRINQLELALLKSLKFDVKVPASEYAKYYFLIRTMLLRSGLVKEMEKPVGKEEAFQRLETRTSNYQDTKLARVSRRDRRCKSMDDNFWDWLAGAKEKPGPVLGDSVCLEQLVG